MTQTSRTPATDHHCGDRPLPGATFGQAVARLYGRYATFSGRASRSEYWWVSLYLGLVLGGGAVLVAALGGAATDATGRPVDPSPFALMVAIFLGFFLAASFVPALALNARRLHDANLSGWLQLVCLVPSVGSLVMTVLALLPSSPSGASYDKDVPGRSPYGY